MPIVWVIKQLSKFQRMEIIQSVFSDNSDIKLEFNNEKDNWNSPICLEIKQSWVKEEMTMKIR